MERRVLITIIVIMLIMINGSMSIRCYTDLKKTKVSEINPTSIPQWKFHKKLSFCHTIYFLYQTTSNNFLNTIKISESVRGVWAKYCLCEDFQNI